MNTYYIEIFNYKDEVFRSYHITAESKREAVARALRDQVETTNTPRFQVQVTEARVDA